MLQPFMLPTKLSRREYQNLYNQYFEECCVADSAKNSEVHVKQNFYLFCKVLIFLTFLIVTKVAFNAIQEACVKQEKTSRERPKSALYLRLKIVKGRSLRGL